MQDKNFEVEFNKLRELGQQTFVLRGSTIIVEILPPEEIKTAGGLVLATDSSHRKGDSITAHRIDVGRVLMTGPGYWVESSPDSDDRQYGPGGKYEPVEVQPGAIVLLAKYSTEYISHFPGIARPTGNKLAMIKMDSILAYYPSQEAYENAKKVLNT